MYTSLSFDFEKDVIYYWEDDKVKACAPLSKVNVEAINSRGDIVGEKCSIQILNKIALPLHIKLEQPLTVENGDLSDSTTIKKIQLEVNCYFIEDFHCLHLVTKKEGLTLTPNYRFSTKAHFKKEVNYDQILSRKLETRLNHEGRILVNVQDQDSLEQELFKLHNQWTAQIHYNLQGYKIPHYPTHAYRQKLSVATI